MRGSPDGSFWRNWIEAHAAIKNGACFKNNRRLSYLFYLCRVQKRQFCLCTLSSLIFASIKFRDFRDFKVFAKFNKRKQKSFGNVRVRVFFENVLPVLILSTIALFF